MAENKETLVNEEQVEIQDSWEDSFERESWVAPLVDIYETDDDFFMVLNMPGVEKENVKVKLEDGSLVVMGKVDLEEISSRKYILKESESGNFYRKFKISNSIDETKIDAKFMNGQLTVQLPKHERVKPKNIEIN